jgi:hypothetical protein
MFGLFRSTKPTATIRRTARLNLEALESRYVPSPVLTLNVTYNGGTNVTLSGNLSGAANVANQQIQLTGQASGSVDTDANGNYSITENASGLGQVTAYCPTASASANATLTDSGATITSFQDIQQPGNIMEFKGTFTYPYAIQGMTLTLNGAPVDVRNLTYSLGNTGTFDVFVQLDGQADDNGMVGAVITDAWGVNSNTSQVCVEQTGT